MRLGRSVLCVIAVGAAAAACKENPTSSLGGRPALISMTPNPLLLKAGGKSDSITVLVLDQSLTPLAGSVTAQTTAASVATVAPANVLPDPTNTKSVFRVTSGAAGVAYIKFSGQGLTDSALINVTP